MQQTLLKVYAPFWISALCLVFACPMDMGVFVTFIELEGFPKNIRPSRPVIFGMIYCIFVTVFYAAALSWSSQCVPLTWY